MMAKRANWVHKSEVPLLLEFIEDKCYPKTPPIKPPKNTKPKKG